MNLAPCPPIRSQFFYPGTLRYLDGGYIYTVQPGTAAAFGQAPAYPIITYRDAAGYYPNVNPIILDNSGQADIFLVGPTKFVVYDKDGNIITSQDNISASPLIQPSSLQWVTQSSVITFLGSTQFSVPGDQTSTYIDGTRIRATMAGGSIYGTISNVSVGGTPTVTTVTVFWDSGVLNNTVTSIAVGIISGGMPTALPIMPVIPITSNAFSFSYTCMGQVFEIASVTYAAVTLTLPVANLVPSGWKTKVLNSTTALAQFTNTINAAAPTLGQWESIEPFSNGTAWRGKKS